MFSFHRIIAEQDLTPGVTTLVRSEEKAKLLETLGLKAVVGNLNDLELLTSLAEKAHVIFSVADADNYQAILALLRGMKKRHETTGDVSVLIHTSGTGYVKGYIVIPSTIYGRANHKLVQAGISNNQSDQIPKLISVALQRGIAGMTGKGLSVWPDIEIGELSDLYYILLDGILNKNPAVGSGVDGYNFGANSEHQWYDISKGIAVALHELGKVKSDDPTSFEKEELTTYFRYEALGYYLGSNSRCRANHSKAIGWSPKKTSEDMVKSIIPECEFLAMSNLPTSNLKETLTPKSIKVPSATPGWNLDAWQYVPEEKSAPYTVIVMAHGLSGNKTMGLKQFAEFFVKMGYAAVVFDYRRWGSSDGKPRQVLKVNEQLEDYRTVIKYCRQQPVFDPNRIVVWGTSFSGGHAVCLAAERNLNVFAAIGQCPYLGETVAPSYNFTFLKTAGCAILDVIRQSLGFSPLLINATSEPKTVGVMNTHDSKAGMDAIVRNVEGAEYPNTINASSVFELGSYSPKDKAKNIECPTLIVHCLNDSLCLTPGADATATASPHVQYETLDTNHFSIYPGGDMYEENLKLQKEFLQKHVPV
ncbi:hypothetical protein EUX98_g4265 [Antrodiella citrinella]|uniref:Serine aminopeptidase S33 domain-containing protein n=1 Tax=Antrodiella citrinella TaxID=2447956 RepID=A0A4S4N2E5_9APHY|nr:hypothetical protein EUX98_g4265 [Antrodiella citrinella]